MIINDKEFIWVEKYRPQCVDDLILPIKIKQKLKSFVKEPCNILLASTTPGTGKTSVANAIIKESKCEALFLNASLERGIDTLRGKIYQFASTQSYDGSTKIVVLDECLEENEYITLLDENDKEYFLKLKDFDRNKKYKCKSFNLKTGKVEKDICKTISDKIDEIYEVELEDGRKIKVTKNHPFIIKDKNGKFIEKTIENELNENDFIVCV